MTRKLATVLFVVFAISLSAMAQAAPAAPAAPAAAAPAGPPPTKIGIINIQAAIVATNEGQRDLQALEKKFEPKRAELQTANTNLENLKKQLNDQGSKLNQTARAALVKNIEDKQKSFRRDYEDAQTDWNNQQNDIANRIGSKLLKVVDEYAAKNGYALILDVSGQDNPVVWANAATNVSKAVVEAYNAQSNVPAPAATSALPSAPMPAGSRPAAGTLAKPAPAKKP